jgi:hypothetical protein
VDERAAVSSGDGSKTMAQPPLRLLPLWRVRRRGRGGRAGPRAVVRRLLLLPLVLRAPRPRHWPRHTHHRRSLCASVRRAPCRECLLRACPLPFWASPEPWTLAGRCSTLAWTGPPSSLRCAGTHSRPECDGAWGTALSEVRHSCIVAQAYRAVRYFLPAPPNHPVRSPVRPPPPPPPPPPPLRASKRCAMDGMATWFSATSKATGLTGAAT